MVLCRRLLKKHPSELIVVEGGGHTQAASYCLSTCRDHNSNSNSDSSDNYNSNSNNNGIICLLFKQGWSSKHVLQWALDVITM